MLWVPLTALRIGLPSHSDENERWNSRTLSSLALAGFLDLVGLHEDDERAWVGVRAAGRTWGARDVEGIRRRPHPPTCGPGRDLGEDETGRA